MKTNAPVFYFNFEMAYLYINLFNVCTSFICIDRSNFAKTPLFPIYVGFFLFVQPQLSAYKFFAFS